MIGNLEPEEHVMGDEPVFRVFTQTSDEPYDRHDYKLTTADGRSFIFDNYEDLRAAWFQNSAMLSGSTVQVLDHKKQKKKSNGGFA